jgi:glycosyltransferase involved in cell wall biosynthesis
MWFIVVGDRLPSDHAGAVDTELEAARSALGDRLVLTGLREDVPAILGALDVFTLPSYREGMPRTIIEAMMMALPVVATDIRGSREEVVDGATGILVPVRDEASLAAALEKLVGDAALRQAMGRAGRARALALYDERVIVARQIDAIRAALPAHLRARA